MQKTIIIIPCFNESKRFNRKSFLDFSLKNQDFLLLFIDDGSKDDTLRLLKDIESSSDHIKTLTYSDNRGKAEAIRYGVNYCLNEYSFKYIGYIDADLSTPIDNLHEFIKFLDDNKGKKEIVIGSRIKRMGAVIIRKQCRHFMGRIFASMASILLQLPIYDTQCGFKLMTKKIASIAFKEPFNSKWLFDIEIFARIIIYKGYKKAINTVYELPLKCWINKSNSKISFLDFILLPVDLIRLYLLYFKKIKQTKKYCEMNYPEIQRIS